MISRYSSELRAGEAEILKWQRGDAASRKTANLTAELPISTAKNTEIPPFCFPQLYKICILYNLITHARQAMPCYFFILSQENRDVNPDDEIMSISARDRTSPSLRFAACIFPWSPRRRGGGVLLC
jgi:hypothetical protein